MLEEKKVKDAQGNENRAKCHHRRHKPAKQKL